MSRLRLEAFHCHLLQPIDLQIDAGECVILSGPSGSGKTLLLRAIADLDPHTGGLALDGSDWQAVPGPEWRRRVGYLPAESHWWGESVGEHLRGASETLLAHLGFSAECLDWSVSRMSSGERQRLALARLLAGEPEVLLLDEPTANLDASNTERVEQCIARYREEKGAAVLWVSHDAGQRERIADRVLAIRERTLVPEEPAWN